MEKILGFYRDVHPRSKALVALVFFCFGILFSVWQTRPIDSLFSIIEQLFYLIVLLAILLMEIYFRYVPTPESVRKNIFWKYHEWIAHLLYGSLLRTYVIFYFKSASFLSSTLFLIFMGLLLIGNELTVFQKRGPIVRSILWTLCLSCFLSYVVPIMLGRMGAEVFLLSMAIAAVSLCLVTVAVWKVKWEKKGREFLLPGLVTLLIFFSLYHFAIIPPVPLILTKAGVYHEIVRKDGDYMVSKDARELEIGMGSRPLFMGRSGEAIHVIVSLFAPAGFKDEVKIRWSYKHRKEGWIQNDEIPMLIHGGRLEGFRGITRKNYFHPGEWRVQVFTEENREIGRFYFDIKRDNIASTRVLVTEKF